MLYLLFLHFLMHFVPLFVMDDTKIIKKLHAIKMNYQSTIYCLDVNSTTYEIDASIATIQNNMSYKSYTIQKTGELQSKKFVTIFLSTDPYHTLENIKNITADIILFYPTNIDLFYPFLTQLNPEFSQLVMANKEKIEYLCPKKQLFLIEFLYGSGYFKMQIAKEFDDFLQLGKYEGILALENYLNPEEDLSEKSLNEGSEIIHNDISDKFTIFVQNALKHKGIICRCMPFGLLFWVFIMKKSYISKSKSIPVGILYIFGWLYYAN